MKKKTSFFLLVLGVPTYGEGVDLVGTKDQIFPMILFEGSPYQRSDVFGNYMDRVTSLG